jgi:hypothetical protein
MSMVGSVLRVCFGLTLAVFMLVNWLVCRLLLLCSCISERTRSGCALVSSQLAFGATLLLSPWIWITAEPGKDEIWAEIQKQLDSDDPRPVFLLGNHTSFMDTLLTVGERSCPALPSVRGLQLPDLPPTGRSKNAYSYRLSVTHVHGGLFTQYADLRRMHPGNGTLPSRIQGQG